jgi:urate oxidase
VVAVDRSSPRHTLVDVDVSSSLRGDFAAAHTAGDNAHVLATHIQKNTLTEGTVLRDDVPPAEMA